jgi:hypothetical protein
VFLEKSTLGPLGVKCQEAPKKKFPTEDIKIQEFFWIKMPNANHYKNLDEEAKCG